ncbi:MAG: ThiF family adenylyltransferase [Muribaculaceae bacterium]|nr:ThiF family adenylyltransferase [Muribaculaceae bacterium]
MKCIYIDKDEALTFLYSEDNHIEGQSYEWEGEDVVHVHTIAQPHAFGHVTSAYWHKSVLPTAIPSQEQYHIVVFSDNEAKAYYVNSKFQSEECKVKFIPSKDEMFSRAKGILEVDILSDKRVMIIGLGSFGSQIAIELAKAGVGEFSLFDFDRVELHNLARHTCTIKDLGRLKTNAIKDAIIGKNKLARVDLFPININEHHTLMDKEVAKADLVICATDNNQSRFALTKCLLKNNKVAIFGRAVTRAEGGDVFRHRPGGPCYNCLVGSQAYAMAAEEITNRSQLPAYVSEEEANAMIQVGLSSDIEPICNLIVKLALVELSKGQNSGIESLENELEYDYYIWANRRERRHVGWAPFNNAKNMPTILKWYGARIAKDEHCPSCSSNTVLDLGEGLNDGVLSENFEGIELDTEE